MKKEPDYSFYLALIVVWMMISTLEQCSSKHEIRAELRMIEYAIRCK